MSGARQRAWTSSCLGAAVAAAAVAAAAQGEPQGSAEGGASSYREGCWGCRPGVPGGVPPGPTTAWTLCLVCADLEGSLGSPGSRKWRRVGTGSSAAKDTDYPTLVTKSALYADGFQHIKDRGLRQYVFS